MTINRNKIVKPSSISNTVNCISNKDNNETAHAKSSNQTKLNNKIEKKYCIFYNRFGRCVRGDSCTYIHDPKRVALCPRYVLFVFGVLISYLRKKNSFEYQQIFERHLHG